MCSDCEASGLKKHGLTRSDSMYAVNEIVRGKWKHKPKKEKPMVQQYLSIDLVSYLNCDISDIENIIDYITATLLENIKENINAVS